MSETKTAPVLSTGGATTKISKDELAALIKKAEAEDPEAGVGEADELELLDEVEDVEEIVDGEDADPAAPAR